MKLKISLILMLLSAFSAFGQSVPPAEAHGIIVVDKEWKLFKEPAYTQSSLEYMRQQKAVINESNRNQEIMTGSAPADRRITNTASSSSSTKSANEKPAAPAYIYEATLKNDKPVAIKEISWEYVFYDPDTRREVGRRRFISKETIRPGKKKTLSERSPSPPTNIIILDASGNAPTGKYIEEIQIKSIKYSDGSMWEYSTPKKQNFAEAARVN